MKRREFLQLAGGMIVGAAIGGNAPNPVVIPNRVPIMPEPEMPQQLVWDWNGRTWQSYDWGYSFVEGFAEGLQNPIEYWVDGRLVSQEEFCRGFICGNEPPAVHWLSTTLDPENTAEYDQTWEVAIVDPGA